MFPVVVVMFLRHSHPYVEGSEDRFIGRLLIDAMYCPVLNVAVHTAPIDDGKEQLILDIETNGTIDPKDAVGIASTIFADQLNSFVDIRGSVAPQEMQTSDR